MIILNESQQSMNLLIMGAISGAITNPWSEEAQIHAEKYYEFIRHCSSDVDKISKNTSFTQEQILLIKNYLFINQHNLDGEIKLFDPCFEIAQSWQRLAFEPDLIQKHDLTLLHHEITEMKLISEGYSQQEAHNITEKKYNYNKESAEFYKDLSVHGDSLKALKIAHDKISGGITFKNY